MERDKVITVIAGALRAGLLVSMLCLAPHPLRAQAPAAPPAPAVPDWALPGSASHTQVAPPKDFHRPSLNFETPNPEIDFASSPFFVNTKIEEWKTDGSPRLAGVTSLGMGGTNAHVVLEQAPEVPPSDTPHRPAQLLLLSEIGRAHV